MKEMRDVAVLNAAELMSKQEIVAIVAKWAFNVGYNTDRAYYTSEEWEAMGQAVALKAMELAETDDAAFQAEYGKFSDFDPTDYLEEQ